MANPTGKGFESYDDTYCGDEYYRMAGLWNLSSLMAGHHLQCHHVRPQFTPCLFQIEF